MYRHAHIYCPAHTPVPHLCLPYDLSWHSGVRAIVPSSFAPHLTSISGHRAQPTSWECPTIPSLSWSYPVLGSLVLSPHYTAGIQPHAQTHRHYRSPAPSVARLRGSRGSWRSAPPQMSQAPATRTHRDPRLHPARCCTSPSLTQSRTNLPPGPAVPRLACLQGWPIYGCILLAQHITAC